MLPHPIVCPRGRGQGSDGDFTIISPTIISETPFDFYTIPCQRVEIQGLFIMNLKFAFEIIVGEVVVKSPYPGFRCKAAGMAGRWGMVGGRRRVQGVEVLGQINWRLTSRRTTGYDFHLTSDGICTHVTYVMDAMMPIPVNMHAKRVVHRRTGTLLR